MNIKKVLLLVGGFSNERNVSLNAGIDIEKALREKGYEVIVHDLKNIESFVAVLQSEKPDVVYNGLYGNWGEDGTVQGFLDIWQIPYTHSGLSASAIGMNKYLTRLVAKDCGIKVADAQKITYAQWKQGKVKIEIPYVVKPVSEGSSCGVFVIEKQNDVANVIYDNDDTELLVEKYIDGLELTAMCLDGKAYVVTQLCAKGQFYDYKAKYTSGMTEHILPAKINDDVKNQCIEYAQKLHNALGCNTISRTDFRYNPKDGVVMLEINTNPGMTSLSLVPEQVKYALNMDYGDLCDKLVRNAKCRKIEGK